jgi:transcriptional regulator with XRE-family HTH domain
MTYPGFTFFERVRSTMGLSQEELGRAIGISRRTAVRWTARGTPPHAFPDLARMVQPHDPDLAAEIAAVAGITLEDPSALPEGASAFVDSIVCAAADAISVTPAAIRPALLAALVRAREMQISLFVLERVLAEALAPKKPMRSANRPVSSR